MSRFGSSEAEYLIKFGSCGQLRMESIFRATEALLPGYRPHRDLKLVMANQEKFSTILSASIINDREAVDPHLLESGGARPARCSETVRY